MVRRAGIGLMIRTVLSAGALAALTSSAASAPAVTGNAGVWAEIVAAYKQLNALTGYRIRITVSHANGGVLERGTLEFARPNMRHLTLQVVQNVTESIDAGDAFRVRVNLPGYPSGWQCTNTPGTRPLDDPQDIQGGLTIARESDTAIGGVSVHAYAASSVTPPTEKHSLYVGSQTGLPLRHVVVQNLSSIRTISFDYYDYGAKITIVLPPCS